MNFSLAVGQHVADQLYSMGADHSYYRGDAFERKPLSTISDNLQTSAVGNTKGMFVFSLMLIMFPTKI